MNNKVVPSSITTFPFLPQGKQNAYLVGFPEGQRKGEDGERSILLCPPSLSLACIWKWKDTYIIISSRQNAGQWSMGRTISKLMNCGWGNSLLSVPWVTTFIKAAQMECCWFTTLAFSCGNIAQLTRHECEFYAWRCVVHGSQLFCCWFVLKDRGRFISTNMEKCPRNSDKRKWKARWRTLYMV